MIHGNQFTADGVPLQDGDNYLTVISTDIAGNTTEASVYVYADNTQPQIRLTMLPQSGLAPFESILTIAGPTTLTEIAVIVDGPADADVDQTDTVTYTLGMDTPGLNTVHVTATDGEANEYTDSIVLQVLDREQLDALLQGKWNSMKDALSVKDIPAAVRLFQTTPKLFMRRSLKRSMTGYRNTILSAVRLSFI